MPNDRAKHKVPLQGWIDKKVFAAFVEEQRKVGATRAELLQHIVSKHLKVKPSKCKAARTGMKKGRERLNHGSLAHAGVRKAKRKK